MLSLKWFKSAIERTIEKVVENKIEQAFDQLDKQEEGAQAPSYSQWNSTTTRSFVGAGESSDYVPRSKPYLNIKMVNDTLTIVMNDGNIITKYPKTSEDFNAA